MSEPWDGKNRRNYWRRLKLRYKMPILIGVPTLCMMAIVSVVSFHNARTSLGQQQTIAFEQLLAEKSAQLEYWLETAKQDTLVLSQLQLTRDAITQFTLAWTELDGEQKDTLQRLYITENPFPAGEKQKLVQADDGSNWSATHARFHADFKAFQQVRDYYDLFLFDLEGNMIYSVFKELDFATNFQTGAYADSGLGEAFTEALNLEQGALHVTEFAAYAPSYGAAAKFMSMPVFSSDGERIGVVALQLPIDQISAIISESELLGETGEVYAVGPDGSARSHSIKEEGHQILDVLPKLSHITAAKQGVQSEFRNVPGLSGNPVIAKVYPVTLPGASWSLVMEQDLDEAMRAENELLSLAVLQALVVLLSVGTLAFFVARIFTKRIDALSKSVIEMAGGDFQTTVAQTKTGDELGDISRAIDYFRTQLDEGRSAIEAQKDSAREQAKVMDLLSTSLAKLSEGSLDCTLNEPFAEAFEPLRHNFNATVTELSTIIDQLKSTAMTIDHDAQEMSRNSESLSQRTENQAATLEQTAAAMDQINGRVKETAKGANEIVQSIGTVQLQAEHGERIGTQTFEAMNAIEESSQEIAKFVQLIDDIAFQTNLLALNAGVEAARAGESGRGFSVVASEVRELSLRSSMNAEQIRTLISNSSENVKKGVGLASEMGSAIKKILNDVSVVSGNIKSIADSAKEQANSLSEVNTGISILDRATQENASMVEHTASSSVQLQRKAGDMHGLVSRFHGSANASHESISGTPDAPIESRRSA